jgi:hypothetical protein
MKMTETCGTEQSEVAPRFQLAKELDATIVFPLVIAATFGRKE